MHFQNERIYQEPYIVKEKKSKLMSKGNLIYFQRLKKKIKHVTFKGSKIRIALNISARLKISKQRKKATILV